MNTYVTARKLIINKAFAILSLTLLGGFFAVETAFAAPVMTTGQASAITATTATLNGGWNDNGASPTFVWFEYGTTGTLGSSTAQVSKTASSGPFSDTLSGLSPSTTYYFRANGNNSGGPANGTILSFTTAAAPTITAPTVVTMGTTNITPTSVTLTGGWNANGVPGTTTSWFEYATNQNMAGASQTGTSTSTANSSAMSAAATNLAANTKYYVRAVAQNSGGITYGKVMLFFTTPASTPLPATCVINSFTASPTVVTAGSASIISWNTSNCTSVTISNLYGPFGPSGSVSTGSLGMSQTYVISASGANGNPTSQVTVSVTQPSTCAINSFYASPSSINSGGATTLYWSTSNCGSNVYLSNVGSVSQTGNYTVNNIYNTTNYTLTATGANGSASAQTTVYIQQQNNTNFCYINSFTATPTKVIYGGTTTLSWNTYGCSWVTISNNAGTFNPNGSITSNPIYGTTTFTLTAYGSNNTTNAIASQTVTIGTGTTNGAIVLSSDATLVTTSSARLNGLAIAATNTNGIQNGWFEYGSTAAFGSVTPVQNLGSSTVAPYWSTIVGLAPSTTYYFRAVVQTSSGTIQGNTMTFATRATAAPATTPAPTVPTQGVGTGSSLISISIMNASDTICPADNAAMTINYQNLSGRTIANAVLTVSLPSGVLFKGASMGSWNETLRTLTVPLPTLVVGANGSVSINAEGEVGGASVMLATATMTFTHPTTKIPDTATAYSTMRPGPTCETNSLAGLALFSGDFWPKTLTGWMVLLIIIALVIWAARELYRRQTSTNTGENNPVHH